MDLTQNKLSRQEWNNLETPVSDNEKTILNILISKIIENNLDDYFFIIDERYSDDIVEKISKEKLIVLPSSELSRRNFYLKNHKKFNTFFCLANVPPPIFIKNKKVIVYFHNELILNSNPFHLKSLMLWIKRLYISLLKLSNYKWVVQTNLMKDKLVKHLKISKSHKNVKILWASVRQSFNIIEAEKMKCHIITIPPEILAKLKTFNKNLNQFSIDTVKMFY